MPVVLSEEQFEAWLDVKGTTPEAASALLQPAADKASTAATAAEASK